MSRRFPLLARGLVLVFALALAAVGFGHRFASASELQRAQFAQLFGAEFCVTETGGGHDGTVLGGSCPVCHIVASIYLPDAVTGAETPAFTAVAVAYEIERPQVARSTTLVSPPQRGPPFV